jgi:hypothetical protein
MVIFLPIFFGPNFIFWSNKKNAAKFHKYFFNGISLANLVTVNSNRNFQCEFFIPSFFGGEQKKVENLTTIFFICPC